MSNELITLAEAVAQAINDSGITTATRGYLPTYTPTDTTEVLVQAFGFESVIEDRYMDRVTYTISCSLVSKNTQGSTAVIDSYLETASDLRKLFSGQMVGDYSCMSTVLPNPIVNETILGNENVLISDLKLKFIGMTEIGYVEGS